MAGVARYGRPDVFITMTCNPDWKEIRDSLLQNQTIYDRPDLVARVFKLKADGMRHLLLKHQIFGAPLSIVGTHEYQKRRGLPHTHDLLTMRQADKPRTAADIDRLICAEIPDPNLDPELYTTVKRTMVHGPCGMWRAKP
jgi:hypothetical protein